MTEPDVSARPSHPDTDTILHRCEELFERAGIPFQPHVHEPVLDYDSAATIRERFHLTGIETKSLFLRAKSGRYLMFVTRQGERLDRARAQQAFGEKVSIASGEELQAETGCIPGCAVPLGLPAGMPLLIDGELGAAPALIFSPGPPTQTLQVGGEDWARLVAAADNPKIPY